MLYVFIGVMALFFIPILAATYYHCHKQKVPKDNVLHYWNEPSDTKYIKKHYKEDNAISDDIKKAEEVRETIRNSSKCAIELEEETEEQDNSIEIDISKKD